ncbi:hypothetical protein Tsp_12656, partial [Trichinella spiralis]
LTVIQYLVEYMF